MTEYKVLANLPKDNYFGTWEKADVKAFGKWFMAEKDNRLQMLFDEIHRDPEFSDWQPDFTPDSLKSLSYWFERNIQAEPLPEDEYQKLIEKYPGMVGQPNKWATQKSDSLVFDVAIYFGEVLLRALGDRQWKQLMDTSTRNLNYGYMYIPIIPRPVPIVNFTPWRLINTLAAKVIYFQDFKKEDIYIQYIKNYDMMKGRLETENNKSVK